MYRKSDERIESALLFWSFVQSFECTLNLLFFLPLVNITSVKLLYFNSEFLVILYIYRSVRGRVCLLALHCVVANR